MSQFFICDWAGQKYCLTSMFSKLGISQDLFAELESISILLVLITSLYE